MLGGTYVYMISGPCTNFASFIRTAIHFLLHPYQNKVIRFELNSVEMIEKR